MIGGDVLLEIPRNHLVTTADGPGQRNAKLVMTRT